MQESYHYNFILFIFSNDMQESYHYNFIHYIFSNYMQESYHYNVILYIFPQTIYTTVSILLLLQLHLTSFFVGI